MAIECYMGACTYHGSNNGDEGPFCFETECRRNDAELVILATLRDKLNSGSKAYVAGIQVKDDISLSVIIYGDSTKDAMAKLMAAWPEESPIKGLMLFTHKEGPLWNSSQVPNI